MFKVTFFFGLKFNSFTERTLEAVQRRADIEKPMYMRVIQVAEYRKVKLDD